MSLKEMNTTQRFSDRVADYDRYRPSYPATMLDYLESKTEISGAQVADIGAGTGIFSKLLLDRGGIVHAVEPNEEMAQAMQKNLGHRDGFHFYLGTAEATGLAGHSVSLITCAQAFHWFDPQKTRKEFDRILKPSGLVALIWNEPVSESPLAQAYDEVHRVANEAEFKKVTDGRSNARADLGGFFLNGKFEAKSFENFQELDEQSLVGRFFSSSFAPQVGTPEADVARKSLGEVFKKFEKNGKARLEYRTELFLGR